MNQDTEASSSSTSSPVHKKNIAFKAMAENVDNLINGGCKQLREQVESVKNLNTLTFYSRLIVTAFEAIDTIIDKLKTQNLFPIVKDTDLLSFEPFAYEYFFKKACDIYKEIRTMFSNAILTSSPSSSTGGGSKKFLMWKKQCNKNVGKIELLIKNTFLRAFHTWFDGFALYGAMNAVAGVLVCLNDIIKVKESEEDGEKFKTLADGFFENFETIYRNLLFLRLGKLVERVKEQNKLLEESNLKGSQEQDAWRKLQGIDDMLKIFYEETSTKDLREINSLDKLQEVEALVKIQEVDFQKKLQKMETQKKLQGQMKLQEEETQKKLQRDKALMNLQEGAALTKLQEEDTQKKLQEDEASTKLQEEEASTKLQEEETQKNLQETEINKKLQEAETQKQLQEEEALKKLQEEKNSEAGDETIEFMIGDITLKMKNGVLLE